MWRDPVADGVVYNAIELNLQYKLCVCIGIMLKEYKSKMYTKWNQLNFENADLIDITTKNVALKLGT